MKKTVLLVALTLIAALAFSVAGAVFLWRRSGPTWTTRSPAAAKELAGGLDAMMRLYFPDAQAHFERALELDPDFAAAKVFAAVSAGHDAAGRKRISEELAAIDLSRLNDRERFLVEFYGARLGGDDARARAVVETYVALAPGDAFAANARCDLAWRAEEVAEAERCYVDLLARWPNWVQAQNHLGYLSMAEGRFAQAEERFRTYLYVAPDQANPYDSLGQLLLLLGRYDEAEESLHKALEIKPDFCESHLQLVRLYLHTGRFADLRETVAAAEEVCPSWRADGLGCHFRAWADTYEHGPEAGWASREGCPAGAGKIEILRHRLAVATGRLDEARRIEDELEATLATTTAPREQEWRRGALAHQRGVRELFAGDPAAAAERFQEAEKVLAYWGLDPLAKLLNRYHLATALALAGDEAGAAGWRAEVEAVNPRLPESVQARELDALVAARRTGR